MKTTNLDTKILELCEWEKSLGGKKAYIYDTLGNDVTANFWALKQLIREQRAEEWNVIHETLHSAGLVSQAHIDKVMDSRLTELTDSNKEDK